MPIGWITTVASFRLASVWAAKEGIMQKPPSLRRATGRSGRRATPKG
jgi:hypothetical protein